MEDQKPPPVPLRENLDPRVVEAELRLRLPGVLRAVAKLEEAKRVSREALELEITI
ncbi:MAG TPA: hypothetical protein VMC43_00705 [Candidatus Paceibacterota bacterium]|nr:hypothetical protein [Candidatus Paceibacterota bacterium]